MTQDSATVQIAQACDRQDDTFKSTATAEIAEIPLKTLKLHPGMHLQTRGLQKNAPKHEAQFLAAIAGKSIMLVPRADAKSPMEVGQDYTVTGFTGQYDFSFVSRVIQIFEVPCKYVLASYPETVKAKIVRRAVRIKTSLPALAIREGADGPAEVTIIDLSTAGAMIASPAAMGAIGDLIELKFSAAFENSTVDLGLRAAICHSKRFEDREGYRIGLSFQSVSKNDRLILHFLTSSAHDDGEIT